VQVGEEDPLDILPPYAELGQTLPRASTGIEEQLLLPGFHERAGPKAVHDGRWTSRTEQSHPELLSSRGRGNDHRDENRQSQRAARADHAYLFPLDGGLTSCDERAALRARS
jgi:hypothetical protein